MQNNIKNSITKHHFTIMKLTKVLIQFVKLYSIAFLQGRTYGETSSMLDGASDLTTLSAYPGLPFINFIDSQRLFSLSATWSWSMNPAFTYRLTEIQTVKTVFFGNREECWCLDRIETSQITIGTNLNPWINGSCSDDVTDGGWYECPTPLSGDIISF